MLADPKARRMATEFFGQWLGFYQFDQFKGVDTSRYPEFTQEVKSSMYDEAALRREQEDLCQVFSAEARGARLHPKIYRASQKGIQASASSVLVYLFHAIHAPRVPGKAD